MPDFSVHRYGTDSSGRGIYATAYMWDWWQRWILADPDVAPFASRVVITQGAWMTKAGGGAPNSEGYHDEGGTFDLRVWNLEDEPGWNTDRDEVDALIWALRRNGAAAYLRNEVHGGFEDDHIHFVLGTDQTLSDGARFQWAEYLAGRDGLSGRGPDYHPRPKPLVVTPPEKDWFDMATKDELREVVREAATVPLRTRMNEINVANRERDKRYREAADAAMTELISELATHDEKSARRWRLVRNELKLIAPAEEPADT